MAKLCYKVGGTVKSYDLKDSVSSSPKLAVKVNGTIKYLGLRQGSKSGELNVKYNGLPYHGYNISFQDNMWKYEASSVGSGTAVKVRMAVWPICGNDNKILAVICAGWEVVYSKKQGVEDFSYICMDPNSTAYSWSNLTKPANVTYTRGIYNTILIKQYRWTRSSGGAGGASTSQLRNTVGQFYNLFTSTSNVSGEGTARRVRDNTLTGSDYATVYAGSAAYSYRSNISYNNTGSGHGSDGYAYTIGADPNISYASVSSQLPYFRQYIACWDNYSQAICWARYIEFPENGLTGLTPMDVIESWKNDLGVNYQVFTPYSQGALASPETVTPVRAPFGFGIPHDEREPNYGKVFDYGETATANDSLGWADSSNSAGAASYSTVQTFTSAHEYKYYPSDNGDSFDGRGWFKIYQHRHGRCIWIVAIVINGVEHAPNTELDIHVGDKIGMRFVINRDGGNGSDNFYGWSYYGRMNVRQLDL